VSGSVIRARPSRSNAAEWFAGALLGAIVFGSLIGAVRAGPGGPPDALGGLEVPQPSGAVTVLTEGFEGAFPGPWTVEDQDPGSGVDTWGASTFRAANGARSAWSAEVGTHSPVAEDVWSEGFEGGLSAPWSTRDEDPGSGVDTWGATTFRAAAGGLASAWCAEVGDNSVAGVPNNAVQRYDNDMEAYLTRPAGLAGYAFGLLTFSYFLDSESGQDYLHVGYFDPAAGPVFTTFTGSTLSWTMDAIPVPSTATEVFFRFDSDITIIQEGAYVDDVAMLGFRGTALWSEDFEGPFPRAWTVQDTDPASGDDHWGTTAYRPSGGTRSAWAAEVGDNSVAGVPNNVVQDYDNDMVAMMTRPVGAAPEYGSLLFFWYWLDSEAGWDHFQVWTYDPGAGWTVALDDTGQSSGWEGRLVYVPPVATEVAFVFTSDGIVIMTEGAYVDNVVLYELAGQPNPLVREYDNEMYSLLYRPVSLTGFTSVTMTYSYWTDTELGYDGLQSVHSPDAVTWTPAATHEGDSLGWSLINVPVPTTAQYVGFLFYSDAIFANFEGAYVDDVSVVGTAPDLSCSASVSATSGTEAATAFDFTGGASGGVPPYAWSWAFGGGGTSALQNPSYTYPLAGTYAPRLLVTDDVGQTCEEPTESIAIAHVSPLTVTLSPDPGSVNEGAGLVLTADVRDGMGHNLASSASFTWSVAPLACGTMVSAGASATFAADADAGGLACTVTASGVAGGLSDSDTASVAVLHAGPITVTVTPATGAVDEGGAQALTVVVADAEGHDITAVVTIAWSAAPAGCGGFSTTSEANTTFTAASRRGGTACTVTATATYGTDTGDDAAVVTVRAGALAQMLPWIVLVVVIVVVLLSLLLLLRRRRPKPSPAFGHMQPLEATTEAPRTPQGPPIPPGGPPPPPTD